MSKQRYWKSCVIIVLTWRIMTTNQLVVYVKALFAKKQKTIMLKKMIWKWLTNKEMKIRNNDLSDRRIDIDIAAEFQSTYINASMTSLSSSFCLIWEEIKNAYSLKHKAIEQYREGLAVPRPMSFLEINNAWHSLFYTTSLSPTFS